MTARRRLLFVTIAAALLLGTVSGPARAQASGWTLTAAPWGAPAAVRDISAWGSAGLAAAGDDGEVAVSGNGGATWSSRVPAGFASTSFSAVAFSSARTGVAASGGVLLATADGGRTWKPPIFRGPAPSGQIVDIAFRGDVGYLVGASGMIFASADGGASWQAEASPAIGDVVAVAVAGDGTVVAGTSAGEVLVRSGGAWAVVVVLADPVRAVAASASPTTGDGDPDLFVSDGSAVLGSDDAVTFVALDAVPAATAWPGLAWLGLPERSSLMAGPDGAGFWTPVPPSWLATTPGFSGVKLAVAPGDQSAAYLLDAGGQIARTLSAGRESATTTLSSTSITVGGRVTYTSVVRIAAPGLAEVDKRVPGRSWAKVKSYAWSRSLWSTTLRLTLRPSLTSEYRVRFRYGGTWATLSSSAPVEVRPKVTPSHRRYVLNRGAVYHFSGTVTPALGGERVKLFTDRGGSWRGIAGNGSAQIGSGGRWTSRVFGTPKAETYHLRAYVGHTRAHGAAWSAVVTVVIR